MIALDTCLLGEVSVPPSTVVHPKVTITVDVGFVSHIGENNIIEELSVIRNCQIGDKNLIEIGAMLEKV